MTWTRSKAMGGGELSFRLAVQRLPFGFVTHRSMIMTGSTPPRLAGLIVADGKLKCATNIASGELDVSSLSASVADLGETASAALGALPSARTWLTANLTSGATTANVRSTAGFASSGTIWIDSEAITYSGVTSTSFTGLTRAALSTIAQAHYVDGGGSLRYPEVTNLPRSLVGARATLYVYGKDDDPQGDGTAIWRGLVSRPPTFRDARWSISIDPISSVLKRALGADLGDPLAPRGIYYPWNRPFNMTLFLGATSIAGEAAATEPIVFPLTASDTAFFETNEDFVVYLNTKIAAATSGWATSVSAVADGDSGWHLEIITDGTAKAVWCLGPGGIDPILLHPQNADGVVSPEVTGPAVYRLYGTADSLPGAGSVPRGYVGNIMRGTSVGNAALAGTFKPRVFYLGGVASVSSFLSSISVDFPAFGDEPECTMTADAVGSVSPRLVTFNTEIVTSDVGTTHLYSRGFTSAALPEIRLGRTYASGGSLWTMLNGIVSAVPDELNAGSVMDLQSADFDSTSWDDLDATWQPRIVRSRTYTSFAEVDLFEVVRAELLLAGYGLGMNASGQLAIFRIRRPVATEAGGVDVDELMVDKTFPSWQPDGVGLVNTIAIRRGYSPTEDDWLGPLVKVRDVAAFGVAPRPRMLTIEPRSQCDPQETNAECVLVAQRILGLLGSGYAMVQADVGLRHFDTLIPGATALITSPHLINTSGGSRGVSAMPALVTGREVELASGRITCTFYAPTTRVAGYAPEAKITSGVDNGGDNWTLTLDTYTFPSGTTAFNWFADGDKVRVWRWDSTTAGTVTGTVNATVGNDVEVQFDSTFTPGADTWVLGYAVSTSATATQLAYVYMADSAGRIDAGTDIDAWGFT